MGKVPVCGPVRRSGCSDAGAHRGDPNPPRDAGLLEGCAREIYAVGRARQIALSDGIVAKSMALLDSLAPSGTTSLQRDIADCKPSELEAWNGAAVRLGREVGLATPLNEFIYHGLLPLELRARNKIEFPA